MPCTGPPPGARPTSLFGMVSRDRDRGFIRPNQCQFLFQNLPRGIFRAEPLTIFYLVASSFSNR